METINFVCSGKKLCYIINIIFPDVNYFKPVQNDTISGHRTKCSKPGRLATLDIFLYDRNMVATTIHKYAISPSNYYFIMTVQKKFNFQSFSSPKSRSAELKQTTPK